MSDLESGRTSSSRPGRARRPVSELFKATVIGGIVFLLPLGIVVLVLGHAMRLARRAIEPIVNKLPAQSILGIGLVTLLSVSVLVGIAFAAGLAARTTPGRRTREWFEQSLLGSLPQYQMLKSMAEGLANVENSNQLKPALVSIEGGWQLGYVLDTLQDGWVAVFLPQAPTPMSGNVMYLPAGRIRVLDMTMTEAMPLVKRLGLGSKRALAGVDLTQPEGA